MIKAILRTLLPKSLYGALKRIKNNIKDGIDRLILEGAYFFIKLISRRNGAWPFLFREFEKKGIHILPLRQDSPVPDTRELLQNRHLWYKEADLSALNFNMQEQVRLHHSFLAFQNEFKFLPAFPELVFSGFTSDFDKIDALILHCFIRSFKPGVVIEIGPGIPTFFSGAALRLNRREGKDSRLICIEPKQSLCLFLLQVLDFYMIKPPPDLGQVAGLLQIISSTQNDTFIHKAGNGKSHRGSKAFQMVQNKEEILASGKTVHDGGQELSNRQAGYLAF